MHRFLNAPGTPPRSSLLTRLDFRTKVVVMVVVMAVAVMWENPLLTGALALAVVLASVLAGLPLVYLKRTLLLMVPFYATLLVTQGFFAGPLITARTGLTPAEFHQIFTFPETWPIIGGAAASWEGVLYAVAVICRTLAVMIIVPLVVLTSDVNTIVVSLARAHVPYKLAFIFASTLRFYPLLLAQIQTIIEAQKLRGVVLERMSPLKRVRVYAHIAVPLILSTLTRAQMLEVALQAKAFSGRSERTYLHTATLRVRDYVVGGLALVFLVMAGIAYVVWGVGRFAIPFE